MLKKFVCLGILLLAAAIIAPAQTIPSVNLKDATGKTVESTSLIDHKTPFVLSMWMTTCKPCILELNTLADEIADWDGGFALRIYAVSIDDSRSMQRAIALSSNAGWDGITPLFDPNGDMMRALNVSSIPHVFVFDAEGRQTYTHIGYRPGDEAELLAQVRKAAR